MSTSEEQAEVGADAVSLEPESGAESGAAEAGDSESSTPAAASSKPEQPSERWKRWMSIAVIVTVAILLPLWIRVAVDGQRELAYADAAAARHDIDAEIEHLGRALRWRAPALGHDEEALGRLWVIGERHRQQGAVGRAVALAAYREVRRGLLATRSVGIPHRERFDGANERIAALMAEQEAARAESESEFDVQTAEDRHRQLLSSVPGPEPVRGHLAALAFAGWLLALGGFVLRGIGPRGRLRPRPALRWGGGALLLLVTWAVLLATAHG